MTGIVDWASARARMIFAFVALSILAGGYAYTGLPKEGSPDIDIPAIFVSVPYQGISAADSEKLLVKPMETELKDLEGLKRMTGTAAEGYGALAMEFEFTWDKQKTLADIRDKMKKAEANFPDGADQYTITEINFSQFPILVIALSGDVPERTLLGVAKDLQADVEGLGEVLQAGLAGHRNEMLEVIIDPLKLESYNVTAGELINVVTNNNQLIAAGEVETETGAFAVKIPSSFDEPQDVYNLPVKVNGDRVVTLGELAEIRLTFEDRQGTARFNGEKTVALQVVKRKGANIIDTVDIVKAKVLESRAKWPDELKNSISINFAMDMSNEVGGMVSQLESSVLTAIALVMMVVLAALGTRSSMLVGFAIPTSFLLCFALLAMMGVAISNIVMFGLILAVGMLVDGAIVVVEYGDKRIADGVGPMHAMTEAAKRMFWPIVSSTATTLCAFLPMLFWPGVPGEFMGMLPVTLIFVLSASLVVALVYLPVVGGVAGRFSRSLARTSGRLRPMPVFIRLALFAGVLGVAYVGAMQLLNPAWLTGNPMTGALPGAVIFTAALVGLSVTTGALKPQRARKRVQAGYRRTLFGRFTQLIAGNPIMPIVAIGVVAGVVMTVFTAFGENNRGVEFFVVTDPERAIAYIQARGNLSLAEKDALVREAEAKIMATEGVASVFAFAGDGGLNQFTGGAQPPRDTIGQVQIELTPWDDRLDGPKGAEVLKTIQAALNTIPGINSEILEQEMGPATGKPVHLRLRGDDFVPLQAAAGAARAQFDATPALIKIDDSRPLPGIDWQIDVDVEKAGRYGADVVTVGAMVQLVTRGLLLDTMRVDTSDDEIDIRVRVPEADRLLATLDTLKVRTATGLVPLSNFITRTPVKQLAQIDRVDASRVYDVRADVEPGLVRLKTQDGEVVRFATEDEVAEGGPLAPMIKEQDLKVVPFTPAEAIADLTEWLETPGNLPPGIGYEWTGDQEDQEESAAFLQSAFMGALGLMFVILLAQFNSLYNSVLVLLAVILSTTGVLIGMMVFEQPFSIIMTGTGIVALAGIVVNNNIILIDTYQEFSRTMPRIEAIIRTAEQRIRPVLLTTVTTMAGLAPMMFGLSIDFFKGGYTIDAPTALWWKQLATAVVFGLGVATVLTLVLTPALLALRVWIATGAYWSAASLRALSMGRDSREARDRALRRAARKLRDPVIDWGVEDDDTATPAPVGTLRAAE